MKKYIITKIKTIIIQKLQGLPWVLVAWSIEISNIILQEEIKVAELNRRLNPYYAINELIYYRSIIDPNLEDYYEYYEPGIGKHLIKSTEDAFNFKKSNKIG